MIKLFTDSGSDISKEEALEHNVTVIPLRVRFGEEEFLDQVTISTKEFFEKLIEQTDLPKTSQLTSYDYENAIEGISKDDEILIITLSKELSGTYKNAKLLEKSYPNVHVIDSANATIGQKILVYRANELIKEGLDITTIVNKLEEEKKHIRLIAIVDTLEYLKKGGRISAATAFIGGMLGIKPVVEIKEGKVVATGKVRGSKNSHNKLREGITNYGAIDFTRPYDVGYSGLSDVMLMKYLEDSKDLYDGHNVHISTIGAVIGTHVGPGAIAVAFFSEK